MMMSLFMEYKTLASGAMIMVVVERDGICASMLRIFVRNPDAVRPPKTRGRLYVSSIIYGILQHNIA